jgi:PPK2 family polyphosphate:nucleotide phosphotransferase
MAPLMHTVRPGSKPKIEELDTRGDGRLSRKKAEAELEALTAEIDELQELMYGAGTHSLLVVLQGMDTSGKDGTIRTVFSRVSPLGSYVHGFKLPTEEELGHDFLWRVHRVTPQRGMIGVFNRSHYEDVLVVRVHSLVAEPVWRARYRIINDFEHALVHGHTIILKFFLHVSKDEQEARLLEREQEVAKAWKLSAGDWRERERWGDYMAAYEEALAQCSTEDAPWHVVPADRKWYRNYVVAKTVAETLRPFKEQWLGYLGDVGAKRLAEVKAFRSERAERA